MLHPTLKGNYWVAGGDLAWLGYGAFECVRSPVLDELSVVGHQTTLKKRVVRRQTTRRELEKLLYEAFERSDRRSRRKNVQGKSFTGSTRAYRSSPCDRVNARLERSREGVRKATRQGLQVATEGSSRGASIDTSGRCSSWEEGQPEQCQSS